MRTALLNAAVLCVSLVVSLAVGEVLVRAFTPFPPSKNQRVADPDLGYRLSRSLPEVDTHGFRNPAGRRDRYTLAAIGDSHTYGNNVHRRNTWPEQFDKELDGHVYNFGIGSYGIATYHRLIMQEIKDKKKVILALYPGNDFIADKSFCQINFQKSDFWRRQPESEVLAEFADACDSPSSDDGGVIDLIKNTAIHEAIDYLYERVAVTWAISDREQYFVAGVPQPILRERLRRRAAYTDTERADVVKLLETYRSFAARWRGRAMPDQLGILVIPSKGRVFAEVVRRETNREGAANEFMDLAQRQNALHRRVRRIAAENDIPVVSALPELAARVAADGEPGIYRPRDGHPAGPAGYAAYVDAAQRLWKRMRQRANDDG